MDALQITHEDIGTPGNRTHITRDECGPVPLAVIADMPGACGEMPGEHRNKHGDVWDAFKADISAGMRYPIFITVDPGCAPHISEGNHRRDAGSELGLDTVTVHVRYYGCAETEGTLLERYEAEQEPEA